MEARARDPLPQEPEDQKMVAKAARVVEQRRNGRIGTCPNEAWTRESAANGLGK